MENNLTTPKRPLLKGWARALLIIIPFLIGVFVFQMIALLVMGIDPKVDGEGLTMRQETILQFFAVTSTLLVVFIFTLFIDRTSIKSIGFALKGYGWDIFLGIIVGAVVMLVGFFTLLALNEIEIASINFDPYKLGLSALLFLFIAVNEEVFLRGYILNNLMQSLNKYLALLLSSVFFALLHFFNPDFGFISFIGLVVAGILLGISYIYTKNLWFPIALHFSWNFFQGPVFGFNVSGNEFYNLITQTRAEDSLLNGGAFGFEGSILSLAFNLVVIVLAWWWFKKRTQTIAPN